MKLSADEIINLSVKQHKERESFQKLEIGSVVILSIIVLITRYLDYLIAFEIGLSLLALYLLYAILSVLNRISTQLATHHLIQTNILRRLDTDQENDVDGL